MRVNPGVKHLAISDFPRTPWPVSFNVRQSLLKAFNYCRQYPDKMASLKATLVYVIDRIEDWESVSKKVEFRPGEQATPLMSAINSTHAVTMLKSGEVSAPTIPAFVPPAGITHNEAVPVLSSNNIVAPALSVPSSELPQRPAMTAAERNPFKVSAQPAMEQEMQIQIQQMQEEPSLGAPVGLNTAQTLFQQLSGTQQS